MRIKLFIGAVVLAVGCTSVQEKEQFTSDPVLNEQIIKSGVLHSPLPLETERSYEGIGATKKVLKSERIASAAEADRWSHGGAGSMSFIQGKSDAGETSVKLSFPTSTGKRIQGGPSDPDYASYGGGRVMFDVGGANWEQYNRIVFYIYPDCDGAQVVNMDLSIQNRSNVTKEGYNRQSGGHLVNLVNKQWNCCFLDIDEYQRDNIVRIGFSSGNRGVDRTTGDSTIYYIERVELQAVENPEIVHGWQPGENRIVYSTTGYVLNDAKTAILNMNEQAHGGKFELISAENGKSVYSGTIHRETTTTGTFQIMDFSAFRTEGYYQLKAGNVTTPAFRIAADVWDNSLWRTLNYIFCQRCGHAVPCIHGRCHLDLFAVHEGQRISYGGGWHDAGDLSQQTLQSADVAYSLLEAYDKLKNENPLLAARMLEEAEWGVDFMLRTRFGDGYRASSVGLLIWQDGLVDSFDDIQTVRVQNCAFDNFLYAGYLSYASMVMDTDPMLQEHLIRIAKEDFAFAQERHEKVGYGEFLHFYEHSYNTSESQYMATVSWAASMLYKATGDKAYASIAAEYIRYTLDCQRKEAVGDSDIKGFFYRDKAKKVIVHYNHQSREQVYMQAMSLLCETQPGHADRKLWEESISLYGHYLKSIMPYTAPYGMLSSGVYHIAENEDTNSFFHLHLFPPSDAQELYPVQVKGGVALDNGEHYLKRFPVWFSIFNGNTAIHLAMGKAAAICGKYMKDEALLSIAREQLYWTVGKNPFGQSLIYGEGQMYPQMDSFSSGDITGEMPVGIRTLGNDDVPYWPQTNTSCYKEVWVTSAGKWISLISELHGQ